MKGRFPLSACAFALAALFSVHSTAANSPTYTASDKAVDIAQQTIIVDGHIDVPYRVKEQWVDVTKATDGGDFEFVHFLFHDGVKSKECEKEGSLNSFHTRAVGHDQSGIHTLQRSFGNDDGNFFQFGWFRHNGFLSFKLD